MTRTGDLHQSSHHQEMEHNQKFFRSAKEGDFQKVVELLNSGININALHVNNLSALHLAAKEGHLKVATELIRRGINVDACTQKGNTALHISCLAGHLAIVEMLLDHGADFNRQSNSGFTPLYMAAQENHIEVVNLLLSRGANESLSTNDGFTPLAVALQQGHEKVVTILLERESKSKAALPALHIATRKDDVNALNLLLNNQDANVNQQSTSGFTPLHIAGHYGKIKVSQALLERGADVNFQAKNNITPLHVAAKWGRLPVVKLFLHYNAKVDCRTRDGLTPLHCAARSGFADLAEHLIENGADPASITKNGLTPLHMAAQGNHTDVARILIMRGVSVEDTTGDLLTPLHVAAHCGNIEVAQVLLERKCDVNARALNGFTPLHVACKKGKFTIVELLIRSGAQISATTESGLSPLHVAAFIGQPPQIVQVLLKSGAEIDQRTMRCETPLHLAVRNCQLDAARILIAHGATVDARAHDDETPLHIAVFTGDVEMVKLLLTSGANPNAPTKDAYTTLHVAAKRGIKEMLGTLLDAGANVEAKNKRGFTALHIAAKHGQVSAMQMLLHYSSSQKSRCDVNAQGRNQLTPIHLACHYNQLEAVQFLFANKADPHCRAVNGYSLLHMAAKYNHLEIAQLLIAQENGDLSKFINAESNLGFIPLHLACQEGHEDMVSLLIQHKANCGHHAQNGLTPLHLAAEADKVIIAQMLIMGGSELSPRTKAGYTPLHTAAHLGHVATCRFLLQQPGIDVNERNHNNCTALHLATQQGHTEVVQLLLDHNANPNLKNDFNLRPVQIAYGEHYLALYDRLKLVTTEIKTEEMQVDEQWYATCKYKPEFLYEQVVSESEDEHASMPNGHHRLPPDQWHKEPYLATKAKLNGFHHVGPNANQQVVQNVQTGSILRAPETVEVTAAADIWNQLEYMRSNFNAGEESMMMLDSSRDITDVVTSRNLQIHESIKDDMITSADWLVDSDNVEIIRQPIASGFLASFVVDARGALLQAQRKQNMRFFIPPNAVNGPTRIIARLCRLTPSVMPPLNDGDGLACRIIELGPTGVKFESPILIEVPHCASLLTRSREIVVMRSENGTAWKEHVTESNDQSVKDSLADYFANVTPSGELIKRRIHRVMTYDLPRYFALITRVRQEMILIGPDGGLLSSSVVPQVQSMFPQGALTKNIRVGLEAHAIDRDLVVKVFGPRVSVSPVITVEPRRRKFHKAITLTMPLPESTLASVNKKDANKSIADMPSLRLLCSIMGGVTPAKWEDITGSSTMTFNKGCVSFTTTVSARLWLIDCPNTSEVIELATNLYRLSTAVPYIGRFVVYGRRHHEEEAQLRCLCLIDDNEEKTLECQEGFEILASGPEVEVIQKQTYWLETAGNLLPVSTTAKSKQLHMTIHAFEENRLHAVVCIKTPSKPHAGKVAFMREAKAMEPDAKPITALNVNIPDVILPINDPQAMHLILADLRSKKTKRRDSADIARSELNMKELAIALGSDWPLLAQELGMDPQSFSGASQQEAAYAMLLAWKATSTPVQGTGTKLSQAFHNIGLSHILKQCMHDVQLVVDSRELNRAINDLKPDIDADAAKYVNGHENTTTSGLGTDISSTAKSPFPDDSEQQIKPAKAHTGRQADDLKPVQKVEAQVDHLRLKHEGLADFEQFTEDMTKDVPIDFGMVHEKDKNLDEVVKEDPIEPQVHEMDPTFVADMEEDSSIALTSHETSMSAAPSHYREDATSNKEDEVPDSRPATETTSSAAPQSKRRGKKKKGAR